MVKVTFKIWFKNTKHTRLGLHHRNHYTVVKFPHGERRKKHGRIRKKRREEWSRGEGQGMVGRGQPKDGKEREKRI